MNIVEIIMNRDGVTEEEAKEMISECIRRCADV
jgi:hypothetical protein